LLTIYNINSLEQFKYYSGELFGLACYRQIPNRHQIDGYKIFLFLLGQHDYAMILFIEQIKKVLLPFMWKVYVFEFFNSNLDNGLV